MIQEEVAVESLLNRLIDKLQSGADLEACEEKILIAALLSKGVPEIMIMNLFSSKIGILDGDKLNFIERFSKIIK